LLRHLGRPAKTSGLEEIDAQGDGNRLSQRTPSAKRQARSAKRVRPRLPPIFLEDRT